MASKLRNIKIKPSKICDGVGIFPIDNILKDEVVLNYLNSDHPDDLDISKLSNTIKNYLHTLWGITDMIPSKYIFHPVNFLNHSENPTVRYDDVTGNYLANRNLFPNDEITINYIGYNDMVYNTFKHLLKKPSKTIKKSIHGGSRKTRNKFKYRRYV